MPWMAIAGTSLVGGILQGNAARDAAQIQAASAQNAANLNYQMWQQQQANMQPWMQTGGQAVQQMYNLAGPGGAFSNLPTAQDVMQYMAPNYQFQLQQGLGQTQNMANATGGMLSGNTLQGMNQFAQNFAQNAYQNAFNNLQTGQSNIFNRLASIGGLGQTTASNLMQGGLSTAQNMGNMLTSGAAAQAAGQIGQANAINQMLGNIGGAYAFKRMLG